MSNSKHPQSGVHSDAPKRSRRPKTSVEAEFDASSVSVRAVGYDQCRYSQGLHFNGDLTPGEWENALERCERDGFLAIWVHYPNVVNIAWSESLVRRENSLAGGEL